MTSTATASFVVGKWEPQATDEAGGTEFARVAIAKTFTGAVEGTSSVELLSASNATSRAYVAFERLEVSVDGRKGGFVLHHSADDTGLTLKILTGSGFGELAGISGTASIEIDADNNHAFTLTYAL
ncbi:DUF3224 domain-containing protein [Amycolatopsis balhimycina DSM 5908]|uniref:DUF3224 domain-containing protein n=1 Tax=Amycolatopsis balhimycina DSM 5908 TaxID=1081091 RepID=A0A428WYI7_AMYBA|nr:DUF3224 domain-containing protein [Amycolatopsis balhimycina]RSM48153.1 DUF3224 domain-containing protein [Amycolatopsis balhimycina DSM 5908]